MTRFIISILLFGSIWQAGCNSTEPLTPVEKPDSTSHNFTWETSVFGDLGSSVLYDVAIVNDTLAYAVGDINIKDQNVNYTPPYGLAIWNGKQWTLRRITAKGPTGVLSILRPTGIVAFSDTEVWFAWGGVFRWNGDTTTQPYWINAFTGNPNPILSSGQMAERLWGASASNLYAVGDQGAVAHYNGSGWQKIESGTQTFINDVFGVRSVKSGRVEIYCAVTDFFQPKDRKILRIVEGGVTDSVSWVPGRDVYSVWSPDGSFLYACGNGVFENSSGQWKEIKFGVSTLCVRGKAANDVFVVGDFGLIAHYNGNTWKASYPAPSDSYNSVAVSGNMIFAVGRVGEKAIAVIGRRSD